MLRPKCVKCGKAYETVILKCEITDNVWLMCPTCLCKFINRLASWKDFDLKEEIEQFTE